MSAEILAAVKAELAEAEKQLRDLEIRLAAARGRVDERRRELQTFETLVARHAVSPDTQEHSHDHP